MFAKRLLIALVVIAALPGCTDDPQEGIIDPPPVTKGSVDVSFRWADSKGSAAQLKVTLLPAGITSTSANLDGTVKFGDLEPGTYSVRVQVIDGTSKTTHEGFESGIVVSMAKNAAVTVDLRAPIPDAPAGLTASKNLFDYVSTTWKTTDRAAGYNLYRSATGTYSIIATPTSNAWKDTQTDPARWYYYKVSARNVSGTSDPSAVVSGYRTGWRCENVSPYDRTDGIGLKYDLHAFGFRNSTKTAVLFAVYKNGANYYFVPGGGLFGLAAYDFPRTPTYDEASWISNTVWIYDRTWSDGWRNNTYAQFIKMRIYKTSPIASLSDPFYAETNFFSIVWSNQNGQRVPVMHELSPEESKAIEQQLVSSHPSLGKTVGNGSESGGTCVPNGPTQAIPIQ